MTSRANWRGSASACEIDEDGERHFVVCSGGGPSIMEAANRGAVEDGCESIGLNIVLPHEQLPNRYVTPELSFQFHYFALRKMHFLLRARAVAVFPGGFGTFDEFFELLTLIQTGKVRPLPMLLFGKEFWTRVVNFEALGRRRRDLRRTTSTSSTGARTRDEAWDFVQRFYEEHPRSGARAARGPSGIDRLTSAERPVGLVAAGLACACHLSRLLLALAGVRCPRQRPCRLLPEQRPRRVLQAAEAGRRCGRSGTR